MESLTVTICINFGYPTSANPAAFIPSRTPETAATLLVSPTILRIKWTVKARLRFLNVPDVASNIRRGDYSNHHPS